VLRARGVGPQRIVGVQHLADVESRSEGAAGLHVLVIMGHVGSEHDPAAAGMDADELHAWGVAADRVQTDARSQLDRSVVEPHPPGEVEPHYADDILDFKRARKERVPHIAPGRVVQLDFLQMKLRRWEAVKRPDMVVMHVSEDHIGDAIVVEPDERQRLRRTAQVPPSARRGDLGGEAGIDHETPLPPDRRPDETVHRHRPVMRIAADEVIGASGVVLGIADRVELVFGKMAVHGAASA
jgi:hypothetical protein